MKYFFGLGRKKQNGPITTKTKHIITFYYAGGGFANAACGAVFDVGTHKTPTQVGSIGFLHRWHFVDDVDAPICKNCIAWFGYLFG